jgi:hypothetical protein
MHTHIRRNAHPHTPQCPPTYTAMPTHIHRNAHPHTPRCPPTYAAMPTHIRASNERQEPFPRSPVHFVYQPDGGQSDPAMVGAQWRACVTIKKLVLLRSVFVCREAPIHLKNRAWCPDTSTLLSLYAHQRQGMITATAACVHKYVYVRKASVLVLLYPR